MKAIIEFNLPEEELQHLTALKGQDSILVLREIDEWLRGKIKYGHEFKSADEALAETRKVLWEFINEYNINELLE